MISTRSVELVIDTVVCLTLAKWETVSGQFGGYLTNRLASDRHCVLRCSKIQMFNMTSQLRSTEQRFAKWIIYAVLAAPIVATLLHDLGAGAVAPWIIYASIAV